MSEATELTNKIIHKFYTDGAYAWRASSTGIFDKKKGHYRTAPKKGVSDVLACYKGILVAVEVKVGSDRLSDEQIGFQKNIIHVGGEAYVASTFEGFEEWWKGVRMKFAVEKKLTF